MPPFPLLSLAFGAHRVVCCGVLRSTNFLPNCISSLRIMTQNCNSQMLIVIMTGYFWFDYLNVCDTHIWTPCISLCSFAEACTDALLCYFPGYQFFQLPLPLCLCSSAHATANSSQRALRFPDWSSNQQPTLNCWQMNVIYPSGRWSVFWILGA